MPPVLLPDTNINGVIMDDFILFERSEFLIDTSQKKSLRVCTRAVCTCARVQ